jgi:arabinofuranosyltransferase
MTKSVQMPNSQQHTNETASTDSDSALATWILWGSGLLLAGILLTHALRYFPYMPDDTLISLRYAERFLEGFGLTWTPGHPVEGYSNLLWVLAASFLGLMGVDLITSVRILGVIGMATVIPITLFWYGRRDTPAAPLFPLLVSLLFYVMAIPIAVWAIAGLEQPLTVALLAAVVPLGFRTIESDSPQWLLTGCLALLLGLLCITRPDGPIFTVGLVAAFILSRWLDSRPLPYAQLACLIGVPAFFYLGQTGFRLYYYGEFVANTALVKAVISIDHLKFGLRYVAEGLTALSIFSVLGLISLFALLRSTRRNRALLLLGLGGPWVAYVGVVGDIFPSWRFLTPAIVLITYAVIEGLSLLSRNSTSTALRIGILPLSIALLIPYFYFQMTYTWNQLPLTKRWIFDGQVIGLVLKDAFSEQQPLIAVTGAGAVPYWSKLPALDMYGLNDYYLPRNPPPGIGSGMPGHELGDGAYVLRQKPDIISFKAGQKEFSTLTGTQLRANEEFFKHYTLINIRGTFPHEYTAMLWFRKYGDKIGIQKETDRISIPAYLFNENSETIAYPNAQGELVVPVVAGAPVAVVVDTNETEGWIALAEASNTDDLNIEIASGENGLHIKISTQASEAIELKQLILNQKSLSDT